LNYFKKEFVADNLYFWAYNIYKSFLLSKLPSVIQLPILSTCNYNCVMCNVPNMDPKGDFSPKELKDYLSDPLFSESHIPNNSF
jgi:wyosine [tRNA(Phe)-imidazoG37] synthetase (radical SAM superfamily)